MTTERKTDSFARLPMDVYEQLTHLPGLKVREKISESLHNHILFLLASNGITIEGSSFRAKTDERIKNKVERRKSTEISRDVYGVRVIVSDDADRNLIEEVIKKAFPKTPVAFSDGKLTARDYRDPEVREKHREKSNPNMSPFYSAKHINFIFRRKGSAVYEIGELQVMTKGELEIYKQTHKEYNGYH